MKGHMSHEDFLSGLRKVGLGLAGGFGLAIIIKTLVSKKVKIKASSGNHYAEAEFEEK